MSELRDSRPADLWLWLFRRRRRFEVVGESMLPLLRPGEQVLIDPGCYRHQRPQVGDVVAARHPHQPDLQLVKRITAVLPDGRYHLSGDNPAASTDSSSFGAVPLELIRGRVVCRFP